MKTTAHFENIPAEIAKLLAEANSEIIIAVAWFTDKTLFDQLCRKAGLGVRVRLAILDDHINTQMGRLNFGRIEEISRDSHVYLIPSGGRNAIMHHKFCVVDRSTLITGSYNWTVRAQKNDENITVIKDNSDICHQYLNVFDTLLVKYRITEKPLVDTTQVKGRLEAVRSLIQLDDWETVQSQMEHIKRATAEYGLEPLQDLLVDRSKEAAVEWIDEFVQRAGAIVLADDMEITFLRLELRCLEIQILSLSDEKAEIERIILNFSQQSSHVLGDLLTRFLKLKALKQKHTAQDDYEQQRAEEAQHDYENYKKANEETRDKPPPISLSTDDTKTLKQLYREASLKVHPDKVSEEDVERATELFSQLSECYRKNDIEGLRAIHAAVKNGNLFVDVSASLTESEALGHKVIELRNSISKLGSTIQQNKQAGSYKKAISIDDLDGYFEEQKIALQQEIEKLEQELSELGIEVPVAAG